MNRRDFLLSSAGAAMLVACTKNGVTESNAVPLTDATATTWPTLTTEAEFVPSSTAPPDTTAPAGVTTSTLSSARAGNLPADGVLVVVEFNGGNDALNTVVPIQGRYHDIRPTIGHNDSDLLAIPGTTAYGLHPALAPMKGLIDAGRMTTLAGVGFELPTRSHFMALDMWWQADPAASSVTGWLGRGLDAIGAGAQGPSSGISLGSTGTALQALNVRTTLIHTPKEFALAIPEGTDAAAVTAGWSALSESYSSSLAAVGLLTSVKTSDAAADAVLDLPGAKSITAQLITAARLIETDPTIRTIYIAARGFDTHANQLERHHALLTDFAIGVQAFFDRVNASGVGERVMMMTTSEFGRRSYENASGGTDHGKAGALFLIGPATTGNLHGDLNLENLDDGDVIAHIDPRSLYATGLDWLGAPADEILGGTFERLW